MEEVSVRRYLPVFATEAGQSATLAAYDAVLDQWPVPFEQLDVPTGAGLTHVIASGPADGAPIILLHAYFATATSWYRTVGALSEHYRTYAVDILGDVGRSCPLGPMSSLDDFAAWFCELLDGLEAPRVHVIGNSVGGFIATYCAMTHPERVRSLTLIAPAATIHSMPAFYTHMFIPKLAYVMLPWLPGREAAIDRALRWMHAGIAGDGLWDPVFRSALVHGTGANRVFPRVFTPEEFSRVEAPTLLLVGDHERIYPPAAAVQAAKRLLPNVTAEIVPGAHHIAAVAQPGPVNSSILRHLAAVEAT